MTSPSLARTGTTRPRPSYHSPALCRLTDDVRHHHDHASPYPQQVILAFSSQGCYTRLPDDESGREQKGNKNLQSPFSGSLEWQAMHNPGPYGLASSRPRHDDRSCMGRRRPPHGRTPLRSVLLDRFLPTLARNNPSDMHGAWARSACGIVTGRVADKPFPTGLLLYSSKRIRSKTCWSWTTFYASRFPSEEKTRHHDSLLGP